jgi:hypothetical protein
MMPPSTIRDRITRANVDAFSVRFLELLKHRQTLNGSTIGRRSIKPGPDGDIALVYGTHTKI